VKPVSFKKNQIARKESPGYSKNLGVEAGEPGNDRRARGEKNQSVKFTDKICGPGTLQGGVNGTISGLQGGRQS